jgi:hypothetical protein
MKTRRVNANRDDPRVHDIAVTGESPRIPISRRTRLMGASAVAGGALRGLAVGTGMMMAVGGTPAFAQVPALPCFSGLPGALVTTCQAAPTPFLGSTAVGFAAEANGTSATAYGFSAFANGDTATAIGGGGTDTTIHVGATATGAGATAIGAGATATDVESTALGHNSTATGTNAMALGAGAKATGVSNNTAIGPNAISTGDNSVALGAGSTDNGVANVVSVGAAGAERRIVNVAAGIAGTDAVNVSQLTAISKNFPIVGNNTSAFAYRERHQQFRLWQRQLGERLRQHGRRQLQHGERR